MSRVEAHVHQNISMVHVWKTKADMDFIKYELHALHTRRFALKKFYKCNHKLYMLVQSVQNASI